MATQMEINYEAIKHPSATLKESVDIIRTSVKDLYSLDEDNYQQIKILKAELQKANDRLDLLTRSMQAKHVKTFFKFVLFGGALWISIRFLKDYCDSLKKRIEELENKEIDREIKEESDG